MQHDLTTTLLSSYETPAEMLSLSVFLSLSPTLALCRTFRTQNDTHTHDEKYYGTTVAVVSRSRRRQTEGGSERGSRRQKSCPGGGGGGGGSMGPNVILV